MVEFDLKFSLLLSALVTVTALVAANIRAQPSVHKPLYPENSSLCFKERNSFVSSVKAKVQLRHFVLYADQASLVAGGLVGD